MNDRYEQIQYSDIQQQNNLVSYIPSQPVNGTTIDSFMHDFNQSTREQFNPYWFERSNEKIIQGMKDVIMSCERDKYFILKVLDFEVITDYERIKALLYNYYSSKTKDGKKIDNEYDCINLRDSDIMLLKIKYYIKLNIPDNKIRVDTRTGKLEQTEGEVEVLLELPIYVNKYYFRIMGNYYNPIFQIVDGSTYNNNTSNSKSQTVTLKTQFMPIKVYKESYELMDIVSKEYKKCTLFTSYVFTKKTDACKFILGRYGYYGAKELLELEGVYIQSSEDGEPLDPDLFYNFTDKQDKVILSVFKKIFDKDNVTQSFCYTVLKSLRKLDNFDDIYDPRYWTRILGADFQSATLDKGIPVLDSFESIYDITTRNFIRLPMEDKADSYKILRWMMREFTNLRLKDNIDISTKHPRMADEYLPAIYAMKISRGIYRISDKGKNVTFKDVRRVIEIPPNYILKNINASNLVDYTDLVNDNDAELALSYTYKGISGLGDQGAGTSVPIIYRRVHPSHLGKVDLDSSSASDPGLSGIICPMANVYNDSFSDYQEPNGWSDWYNSVLTELRDMNHIQQGIELKKKLGLSYDYVKDDMVKETIASYQRYIPGIIDIYGKKDYTLGTVLPTSSPDGYGAITYSEEIPPKE